MHAEQFPVDVICGVFGVSRSGYYAWRTRPQSARGIGDAELGEQIEQIHAEKRRRYGAVRIWQELRQRGRKCSKKRVARLMRQRGLNAVRRRKWVRTTDAGHALPVASNVLNREFTASQPNRKWAGDIMYVPTAEGWLYRAVIIDLFSRRVIGWSMSKRIDQRLTRLAIVMALRTRRPN
ncbi:MAG: insF1, partial [Chlorobi bacterium]|nr:insF1 [Chlorobiota bacterium]